MSWKIVTLTNDEAGITRGNNLQDAFEELFIANGAPKDAAMYGNKMLADGNNFWFSPAAAEISKQLLESYNAQECEAPDVQKLVPIVTA
jgi:hypothetical protein